MPIQPLLKTQKWLLMLTLQLCFAANCAAKPIDSLFSQFDKAEQKSSGNNVERQTINIANSIFSILQRENITDEPIKFSYETPADSLREQVWYWAGEYYYANQQYQQTAYYAAKALPLFRKAGDNEGLADCLNLLAITHVRISDYKKAAEYAMQCYKLDIKSGDPNKISSSLNTLAGIYLSSHQFKTAEKFVLEALQYANKTGNKAKIALLKGMASEIYQKLQEYPKSLSLAKEAYDIETGLGHTDKAAIRLTQMATAMICLNQYSEAKQALDKAIPTLEKSHNKTSLGIAYNNMGELMLMENNQQKAAEYYKKASSIFCLLHDANNESVAQLGLYKALKNSSPAQAMDALERHRALKDSIFDSQTAESLGRYNAQVGNIQLAEENEEQRRSKQKAIIGGILSTLLIAIVATIVWIKLRRSNKQQNKVNSSLNENINELKLQYKQLKQQYTEISERTSQTNTFPQLHNDDKQFIEKLIDTINEQISTGNIDATTVSERLNMSPFQLRTRLASLFDETPKNFIQSVRMKRALHYLENFSDKNINEIAALCAYNETSNFTRAFKNTFGITPSQYLEEVHNSQAKG